MPFKAILSFNQNRIEQLSTLRLKNILNSQLLFFPLYHSKTE
jgi:hypothetical protein